MKDILIYTLIITLLIYSNQTHLCNHDKLPYSKLFKHREIKQNSFRKLTETEWTPIRIHLDYTTFDTYTNISLDLRNKMKEILSQAIAILNKLLKVKRTHPIKVPQGSCWGLVKLSKEVSQGIDTDLVVFPVIDRSYENALAYASSCDNDEVTGRPNIGMIAFLEKRFDIILTGYFQRYVNIALHELTHVLGFAAFYFKYFIDENGVKIPYDKVVQNKVINGITKNYIITPRVVQAARKHFNCEKIIGVELENQGGSGTTGSHWEGRLMNGEFMTGGLYHELAISEITLAFLEDSGFYQSNYFTGGLFRFGKNAGCSFMNKPCLVNGRNNFLNEYCDEQGYTGCTSSSLERGMCYIYDHGYDLPAEYQYFPGYSREGGSYLNDHCPILIPFRDDYDSMSCVNGKSLFEFTETGETFDTSSLCFMSSVLPKGSSLYYSLPFCYATECDYVNKKLKVTLYGKTFECSTDKEVIHINDDEDVSGSFVCPIFNMVCTNKEKCFSILDCVNKESVALNESFDYFNK